MTLHAPHDDVSGRFRTILGVCSLSLVAEVLSQSTARADRTVKRPTYQSERIPEYWIVDADARLVECWRPEDERPAVLHVMLTWRPKEDVPPLEINLPEFFAAALD